MTTVTISSIGWIVIPAALRKKYDLHPVDSVALVDYSGALVTVPAALDPVWAACGLLQGDTSLMNMLLEEHAREISREP